MQGAGEVKVKYLFDFILAVTLNGFSYYVGSMIISSGIPFWQAFIIGFTVVSLGALTEFLGSPMWLIVLVPFPAGMLLLYLFLGAALPLWFLTYITTLTIYVIIHIPMSYFFRFHSLIPSWRLS
jgi:hypothetical protein